MKRQILAGFTVLSLVLAACGSDDDSGSDGSTAASTAATTAASTAATTAETTAETTEASVTETTEGGTETTAAGTETTTAETTAPVAAGNPDGTIRMAAIIGIRTMDPLKVPTCGGEWWTLSSVYARLIELTRDRELQPMLAESWEFTDGGAALELALRTDLTFDDGTPFNADAVKQNLDRYVSSPDSLLTAAVTAIESVDVVDDSTVKINLKPGTGASLPYDLAACAGMMVNPASFDNPTLDQTGDGLGPYAVEPGSFSLGEKLTLVRKDDWWGDPTLAQVARIEGQKITDESARVNAIGADQLDVTHLPPSGFPAARDLADSDDGVTIDEVNTTLAESLIFNLQSPDLQDVRVRRAIALAIDREAINEALWNGGCPVRTQPLGEGEVGYVAELDGTQEYDPEEARSLLEEAGVSDLTLTGVHVAQNIPITDMMLAIQAQLAEVGITLELGTPLISNEAFVKWGEGNDDLFLFPQGGGASSVQTLRTVSSGRYIIGGATIPAVVEALAGVDDPALSDDERATKAEELSTALVEEVATVYICSRNAMTVSGPNVIGGDTSTYTQFGTFDVNHMAVES